MTLFFSAQTDCEGAELWKRDGTDAGTVLVRDINPGVSDSLSGVLRDVGGKLAFVSYDSSEGHEVWQSDGDEEGTKRRGALVTGKGQKYPVTGGDVI